MDSHNAPSRDIGSIDAVDSSVGSVMSEKPALDIYAYGQARAEKFKDIQRQEEAMPEIDADDILGAFDEDVKEEEAKDKIFDLYESRRKELSKQRSLGQITNEQALYVLLEEFGEEEALSAKMTVLKRFQDALTLPISEDIPQEDQATVTELFNNANVSFDQDGLDAFCDVIQQNEELSVETKRHVLKKLGVERTFTTGKGLNKALEATAIDPKTGKAVPVHDKDNPIRLQTGAEAYINEKGERVIVPAGKDGLSLKLRDVNAQSDNAVREQMRVAFALNAMPEEMVYALFGEHQVGERGETYSEKMMDKVNIFMEAMLPNRMTDHYYLPNEADMVYFRNAVDALTHNKSMGKVEIINDLKATGLIHEPGHIDFEQARMIGSYFRKNQYNKNKSFAYGGDAGFDDMVKRFGSKKSSIFRRMFGRKEQKTA